MCGFDVVRAATLAKYREEFIILKLNFLDKMVKIAQTYRGNEELKA